jgi:hypothetical protein
MKELKKIEDLNQMPLFELTDLIKQHLLDLMELAKKKVKK